MAAMPDGWEVTDPWADYHQQQAGRAGRGSVAPAAPAATSMGTRLLPGPDAAVPSSCPTSVGPVSVVSEAEAEDRFLRESLRDIVLAGGSRQVVAACLSAATRLRRDRCSAVTVDDMHDSEDLTMRVAAVSHVLREQCVAARGGRPVVLDPVARLKRNVASHNFDVDFAEVGGDAASLRQVQRGRRPTAASVPRTAGCSGTIDPFADAARVAVAPSSAAMPPGTTNQKVLMFVGPADELLKIALGINAAPFAVPLADAARGAQPSPATISHFAPSATAMGQEAASPSTHEAFEPSASVASLVARFEEAALAPSCVTQSINLQGPCNEAAEMEESVGAEPHGYATGRPFSAGFGLSVEVACSDHDGCDRDLHGSLPGSASDGCHSDLPGSLPGSSSSTPAEDAEEAAGLAIERSASCFGPCGEVLVGDFLQVVGLCLTADDEFRIEIPAKAIGQVRSTDDDGDLFVCFPSLVDFGICPGRCTRWLHLVTVRRSCSWASSGMATGVG